MMTYHWLQDTSWFVRYKNVKKWASSEWNTVFVCQGQMEVILTDSNSFLICLSQEKKWLWWVFWHSGPGPVCSGFVLPWKALTEPENGVGLGSAMRLRGGMQCVYGEAGRSQRMLITPDWLCKSGHYHVECLASDSLFPGCMFAVCVTLQRMWAFWTRKT